MNALDVEDMKALSEIWVRFKEDEGLLVAVVTGAGSRSFCAGANLKSLIPIITGAVSTSEKSISDLDFLQNAFLKKIKLYKPVIAAVNGYCIAGGMELLQATDIRVASENAVFSLQGPKWGLFPAGGSTVRLPRQIPFARAMEILLTGGRISAEDAYRVGLVNRVVPPAEVLPAATEIARAICENGPLAVRKIKESALRCLSLPEEQAFALEDELAQEVFSSKDAVEGPSAFSEKRKPVFTGA